MHPRNADPDATAVQGRDHDLDPGLDHGLDPGLDPDVDLDPGTGAEPEPISAMSTPSPASQAETFLGRFILRGRIGSGGMGEVWEAWDPHLQRPVAIKRLQVLDPLSQRRFLREARLQASLAHPGICPVFEVGQLDGLPYLVMPRLDGQPLDQASRELPLESKLLLFSQVADAVHAAHRQGLIHRDLKPSNILVESPDHGPPRPIVLDFGIARPASGAGSEGADLTATGQVVGTPAYMAPEQVRGEAHRLDRRTDVYALGATLYRLLAGRPPHEGHGGTLMVRILRETPARLRPGGIPADVEAIVFRCLEKDPGRRYDSALALAEDLRRYLEGQPVLARRIGLRVRLAKWLGRHRAAARVAAVAALAVLGALGWATWSNWRSEELQRLARRFGAEVEQIEALVRYSHLVPLHDLRPDQAQLRRRLDALRAHLDHADSTTRALAHHALGRGRLALDELEAARLHLETAHQLQPEDPEIAVDLGRALSELYRDRLTALERLGDRERTDSVREQLRRRLDATFGPPAEQQHQLARRFSEPARALLASGSLPAGRDAVMLQALRLFHGGRPAEALDQLTHAPKGPSWDYERKRLEGDIRRSWAVTLPAEADDENAVDAGAEAAGRQLELARQAYAEALAVAESNAAILRDDAQTVYLQIRLGLAPPERIEPLVDEGLERLRRARIAAPDDARGRLWSARLLLLAAEQRIERARDPLSRLEPAVEAAERALELGGDTSIAWYLLGRCHWQRARWALDRGEDPEPHFAAVTQAFEKVANEHRGYAYFTSLGLLHMSRAGRRAELGLDVGQAYERSIDAYRRAAELHSAPFAALANLGISLFNASSQDARHRLDLLHQSLATFEQARGLDPDHMLPHYYLGLGHLRLAQEGDRASPTLDTAQADQAASHLEQAVRLSPDRFQPWVASGELFHLRALNAYNRGTDPSPLFAQARRAHGRALELAPDHGTALLNLAWTVYFEGKFALRRGRDASSLLAEAEDLCRRSLAARRRAHALLCLGSARRLQAEALIAPLTSGPSGEIQDRAVDTSAELEAAVRERLDEAERCFEAMLADGEHAEARRSLGRLFTLEAHRQRRRGADPRPALDRARRELDQALELAGEQFFFLLADAHWHLEYAAGLEPADAAEALAEARRALEQARPKAPDSPELERLSIGLAEPR